MSEYFLRKTLVATDGWVNECPKGSSIRFGPCIYSLAFSPKDNLLATGANDHIVRIWKSSNGELLHTLEGHTKNVICVTFSHDGNHLASASSDTTVIIWDANSGKLVHTLVGHQGGPYSIAFSPTGNLAAPSGKRSVFIWNTSSGECLRTLEHDDHVDLVSFSPDGRHLISVSDDNIARVWYTSTWKCFSRIKGPQGDSLSIAMSPRSGMLALTDTLTSFIACQDGNEYHGLWKLEAGDCGTSENLTTFLPDDRLVRVFSNRIQIFETASGEFSTEIRTDCPSPNAVASSSDGKSIAIGLSDGRTILLDANNQETQVNQSTLVPFESAASLLSKRLYDSERRKKVIASFKERADSLVDDARGDPELKLMLSETLNTLITANHGQPEKTREEESRRKRRRLMIEEE